jgi:hypothetical protein
MMRSQLIFHPRVGFALYCPDMPVFREQSGTKPICDHKFHFPITRLSEFDNRSTQLERGRVLASCSRHDQ